MFSSVKFAFRHLAQSPGFTFAAVGTLALCLGANLTLFALIDRVLVHPLPLPEADRLVTIYNTYPRAGVERDGASLTNYYERRGRIPALASVAIMRPDSAVVGLPGAVERVTTARISADFFATLGVPPATGRAFTMAEMDPGSPASVIVTAAFWRSHGFTAHAAELRVDGVPRAIVGVLPPSFPSALTDAQIFLPYVSDPASRGPASRHTGNAITMIGRLAPGATLDELRAQIAAQDAALAPSFPQTKLIAEAGFHSVVVSLSADLVRAARPLLLLLQGGVLCLLLIGTVNLLNLLLVRSGRRTHEIAVRRALGATRGRLVLDVVAEVSLLTMAGGGGACLVAAFGVDCVGWFGPNLLPLTGPVVLGSSTFAAGASAVLVLTILLALPVAWLHARLPLGHLHSGTRSHSGSHGARRWRQGFIVAQVALTFVLLAGAGLLAVSFARAARVRPGFQPAHALTGRISLPAADYPGSAAIAALARDLATATRAHPAVTACGIATNVPFSGQDGRSAIVVRGWRPAAGESVHGHYVYGIAGDYFAALGIPMVRGRLLDAADFAGARRSCVVDEDFARRYWPDGDALGGQIFFGASEGPPAEAFTVVGIVGAVKQANLAEAPGTGAVYLPLGFKPDLDLFVVVRGSLPAEELAGDLRSAVRRTAATCALSDLRPMQDRVSGQIAPRRSSALLAGLFATVALLLAGLGTYAVLSYAVLQRQREIGVRLALGAQPVQVQGQFLAAGFRLVAAGLGLGLAGVGLASSALRAVLFGIKPLDPPTLALAAVLLAATALFACWFPARRATHVDPMVALRAE